MIYLFQKMYYFTRLINLSSKDKNWIEIEKISGFKNIFFLHNYVGPRDKSFYGSVLLRKPLTPFTMSLFIRGLQF